MPKQSVRLEAAHILKAVFSEQCSLTEGLARYHGDARSKLQALCFGVCREYGFLSAVTNKLLKKPLPQKALLIHCLLLQALFELMAKKTPVHAVVNETIRAAKQTKFPFAPGLLNGCCRTYLREEQAFQAFNTAVNNHPSWLLEKLKYSHPNDWQTLCDANQAHPPMTLRINQQKITREKYIEQLSKNNIAHTPTTYSPYGIMLTTPIPVDDCPGFSDGLCSIQDEAGQLLSTLVMPKPGQRLLDACAAPGSKLCQLLEQEPKLEAVALDIDPERLKKVQENLNRLTLSAQLECLDATEAKQHWPDAYFDIVLLDAPCSATGVIRRHPDIKWLRKATDIPVLANTQQQLMRALWPLLKPGGKMIYSTCSVLNAENQQTVTEFIDNTSSAICTPIAASWGTETINGRQILPGQDNMDGFFYAQITKEA